MRLVIFHYHFLTGGVTTAVRHALQAIRAHLPEVGEVRLVGGRCADGLPSALALEQASYVPCPELDYREPPDGGAEQAAAEGRALASALLQRHGGSDAVWWVHNHHLGKNPVFTHALLEALERQPAQRAILQIHDFPECGRHENLRALRRSLSRDPYPVLPGVRYAVLTPRDQAVLVDAGLPAPAVHLLGNPVPAAALPRASSTPDGRRRLRERLTEAFGREFPGYDPGRPLLVYPVRTIRRKNVLEACLLARLPEDEPALVVTLPGISRRERPYSDRVEQSFRAGHARGLWGIGSRLGAAGVGFEELIGGADLVVSSAVQEGYGYLFVNSLQWRKPLLARDLDVLEGTRELFAGYPAHFYSTLACPFDSRLRHKLRAAYGARLERLADTIPKDALEDVAAELAGVLEADRVDFSYLPTEEQAALLERLPDLGLARELRQANPELAAAIPRLLASAVPDRRAEVEERFGTRRFAAALAALLGSFGAAPDSRSGAPARPSGGVQERLVRRFARLEHLRLLFD